MQIYHHFVFLSIVTIFGYEDLSTNKSASQSSTGACYPPCTATTAVDGSLTTCMKTVDIGVTSTQKSVWWYVDLGNISSIYSIRIHFRDFGTDDRTLIMRQQGRFAGFSLYVSNSTNKENGYLCYQDGPELPPLDFNTTCVTHGRFVIFYNERLNGIIYPSGYQTSNVFTELCEVTVTGCRYPGVYGYDCDLPCPENCQERRCYIVNGTCLGCKAGWTGEFCNNSCPAGYYGLECRTPCTGHCRDNKPCNHITGECDEGCANGWTGTGCSKECPAETYGPDCIYNCSGHCVNGVPCNRTTGSCDSGCKPGYTGEPCEKACSIGLYGLNCTKQCTSHCRHGIKHCNHKDGHCELGCQDGFIGLICNETCDSGRYGTECARNCSENCHNVCNHIDGSCICSEGLKGSPDCTEECSLGYYGLNCRNKCSKNCKNRACNKYNGTCTYGCTDSYGGHKCDQKCLRNFEETDSAMCNISDAYIAGLSLSLLINVLLAVAFILFFRRFLKRDQEKMSSQYIDSSRTFSQLEENHSYQELYVGIDNSYQNTTLRDSG